MPIRALRSPDCQEFRRLEYTARTADYWGILGNGTGAWSTVPLPIAVVAQASAVDAGFAHSLALAGGRAWGWGSGELGQVGGPAVRAVAGLTSVGLTLQSSSGPIISYSPSSLDFDARVVGDTGSSLSITLTNGSAVDLQIASIGLGGIRSGNGDFAELSNCLTILSSGASCIVDVTFVPLQYGQRGGYGQDGSQYYLDVEQVTGEFVHIALSGTGVPAIAASQDSFTFPQQPVKTNSAPLAITLTNRSNTSRQVNSLTVAGDFALDFSDCGLLTPKPKRQ